MTCGRRFVELCAILSTLCAAAAAIAGDLNPPVGPVTGTMKTLVEVEPRIAVNATNTPGDADSVFRIAASGSYYLTGNITGVAAKKGIEIAANNVSLDLRGFALIGAAGSLDAVQAPALQRNLIIRDGTIYGWGGGGVVLTSCRAVKISGLAISEVGTTGIKVMQHSLITGCTIDADSSSGPGISVTWSSVISNCHAQTGGDGISISQGCNVIDCVVDNCGDDGILASGSGNRIERCVSYFNGGDGIEASGDNAVVKCTAYNNSLAGIHVTGADNRIDGNDVTDNVRGIDVDAAGNVIIRNTASGSGTDYDILAGNDVGPIGTAAAATSPWANIAF